MKRIALFVITNILIISMISIVVKVFRIEPYLNSNGVNFTALLVFCTLFGFGGAFISLAISKWAAKWMMGVKTIDPRSPQNEAENWVYTTVARLAHQANLPSTPEVGIYDSPEVNAFATGATKRGSLVAVSTGLLQSMNHDEAEAVLAHEVSHISNGDMVTMTLVQGVVNTFSMFLARVIAWAVSRFVDERLAYILQFVLILVLQMVFSILGSLVVMAFSRTREFRADAGAARLCGKDKMISALRQLQQHKDAIDTSQPALATMKIAGAQSFMQLFSSHPPLEDRIHALESGN